MSSNLKSSRSWSTPVHCFVSGMTGAVCEEARGRLSEFSPQNISNLLYGVGLLQFLSQPFLHDTCSFSSVRMSSFSVQGISNMTYALGLLGYQHPMFLRSICGSLREHDRMREEVVDLKITVDGLEKERDFYFRRLRDIEIMCEVWEKSPEPSMTVNKKRRIPQLRWIPEAVGHMSGSTRDVASSAGVASPGNLGCSFKSLIHSGEFPSLHPVARG
eukprot:g9282.t1